MPTLIEQPVCFRDTAVRGDEIQEFVGRISTGNTDVSIGVLSFPQGWFEPPQTPEFDEYSIVFEGTLYVDTEAVGTVRVRAGQGILTSKGQRIRYRTPEPGGAKYLAVCLPAFAPELAHREGENAGIDETDERTLRPGEPIGVVSRPAILQSAGKEICQVEEFFGRFNDNATEVGISRIHISERSEGVRHCFDYDQYVGVLRGRVLWDHDDAEAIPVTRGQGAIIRDGESFRFYSPEPGGADLFHVCMPARSLDFERVVRIVEQDEIRLQE